jgi:hypothetical protein
MLTNSSIFIVSETKSYDNVFIPLMLKRYNLKYLIIFLFIKMRLGIDPPSKCFEKIIKKVLKHKVAYNTLLRKDLLD